MGQAVSGVCTAPSEMVDSQNTTNIKVKQLKDLPIDISLENSNRVTNRITLRPDEVVEALTNPPFWDAENQN